MPRSFASDNNAPVHPALLEAVAAANAGHVRAYGDDPWTERLTPAFRALFGASASVWPVFGGTGANVLALGALLERHEAVVCAQGAHIAVDECGAPERHLGTKLLAVATPDGKLRPDDVLRHLTGRLDEHHVQPRAVSITQATEVGTVYTPAEVAALGAVCRAHGLYLHLDGARIANAAASLGVPVAAFTTDAGVDVVSFGGTKNGALGAEAVVFLTPGLDRAFRFQRKQGLQLASKMRYASAQLLRLVEGGLWIELAAHSNAMARRLAAGVRGARGVEVVQPVQANGVFARVPHALVEPLQRVSFFYVWDHDLPVVRWMCSFDTTEEDVDRFAAAVHALAREAAARA
jgi:threonine aldolase